MKCQVYSSRPEHCRNFDCLLLEKVKTSERSFSAALKVVRRAHRLAERVGQLMMQLGNTEEHLPMANRFRHVARAMEKPGADAPKNKTYAELTLGYHELTLLLSAEFYQGGH